MKICNQEESAAIQGLRMLSQSLESFHFYRRSLPSEAPVSAFVCNAMVFDKCFEN